MKDILRHGVLLQRYASPKFPQLHLYDCLKGGVSKRASLIVHPMGLAIYNKMLHSK